MLINNMRWERILQAIFSAPAIILDVMVQGLKSFFIQEKELLQQEEFDDDDVMESRMEQG